MVSEEDLAREVQALLARKLAAEVESVDADLLEAGFLNSLTLVELLWQLEEHFGFRVVVEELDIENLRSVRSIARLVAGLKRACAAV
jgi:acyl carrier protein